VVGHVTRRSTRPNSQESAPQNAPQHLLLVALGDRGLTSSSQVRASDDAVVRSAGMSRVTRLRSEVDSSSAHQKLQVRCHIRASGQLLLENDSQGVPCGAWRRIPAAVDRGPCVNGRRDTGSCGHRIFSLCSERWSISPSCDSVSAR
jgi:hypothetical protein